MEEVEGKTKGKKSKSKDVLSESDINVETEEDPKGLSQLQKEARDDYIAS